MKIQIHGSSGQLTFYFGNKADTLLQRLLCVVPPAPQFAFQLGAVPSQLEPKKQISVSPLRDHTSSAGPVAKLQSKLQNINP